mgnify:CR=1 FL=1|jgi:hypothetical protein
MKKWMDIDIQLLKDEYPKGDLDILAAKLNVTRESLRNKAKRLKIKRENFKNLNNKKSSEEFNQEIKKFNLELVSDYTTAKSKVSVMGICGHIWEVIPANLLSSSTGSICRECKGWKIEYRKWTEEDKKQIEEYIKLGLSNTEIGNKFNTSSKNITTLLSKLNIKNNLFERTKKRFYKICEERNYKLLSNLDSINNSSYNIEYECSKGHKVSQILNNIISRGDGCPECSNKHSSTGELELLSYIKSIIPKNTWIITQDRKIIAPKQLDIVLPDLGIAIEYNGNYFHSDIHVNDNYHLDKYLGVKDFEYRLLMITDEEWLNKNSIVKSRLNNIFSNNQEKIYARKCNINEIPYSVLKEFCDINHIQGSTISSINLGLFFNSELVGIMSFGKARYNKNIEYELLRFCSKLNTNIIGGASKLLKYFEITRNPKSLISYSDNRWNTGNLYRRLGMEFSHNTTPNYRYVKSLESYSRIQFQKHLLLDLFPDIYSEDKTEREIMKEAGYHRVYDCGNSVFIKFYK